MKILLIYPYCLEDRIHAEDAGVVPIGLYYIGAALKDAGHDVEIVNAAPLRDAPDRIRALFLEKAPRIIGFSVLNANRWGAIDMAGLAREIDPSATVAFGGVGATSLCDFLLSRFGVIDYIVLGEGEYAFRDLVAFLQRPTGRYPDAVPGLAFRKGKTVVKTPPAPAIPDLDALPDPADHFTFQHVALSRGCPWNCVFCGSPEFWGRKIRFHSPEYFVGQLERLRRKGVSFFYVSDDNFMIRKKTVIDICKKIIDRRMDISWAAISRVSYADAEVLSWMRRAGCIRISYGVESGSADIRRRLDKKLRREDIENAFDLTIRCGILPRVYFIYGSPGESDDTIQETIDLMNRIKPLGAVFYILDIFPGAQLYADYREKNPDADDLWMQRIEDLLYFETDPSLTGEQILAFGKRLRTAFHKNLPAYVEDIRVTDDPEFKPLHADFFSRLAMTFSHGDYAGADAVPDAEAVAERLYARSLTFGPNARAYLGLAMIYQKKRAFQKADGVLSEGLGHFPDDASLNMCMGINCMNQGKFRKAPTFLLKCPPSREREYYLSACRRALGR